MESRENARDVCGVVGATVTDWSVDVGWVKSTGSAVRWHCLRSHRRAIVANCDVDTRRRIAWTNEGRNLSFSRSYSRKSRSGGRYRRKPGFNVPLHRNCIIEVLLFDKRQQLYQMRTLSPWSGSPWLCVSVDAIGYTGDLCTCSRKPLEGIMIVVKR